ncbi:MAG: biotin/lipoyl-binding protein, partial [Bryobacteraceae bacterium]
MKKRRKTLILCGLLLVIAVVIFASVRMSKRGLVTVQTGQVAEMNLTSLVTATGEIKPRNYINLGANTEGPAQITAILVKEGDRVKKGQVLARLASVQPAANVSAQQAVLKSALASSAAA